MLLYNSNHNPFFAEQLRLLVHTEVCINTTTRLSGKDLFTTVMSYLLIPNFTVCLEMGIQRT